MRARRALQILATAVTCAASLGAFAQTTVWERLVGNQRIPSSASATPFTHFLAVDANGNAFLASEADTPVGSCFVVTKYDPAGTQSWRKSTCTDHFGTTAMAVAVDSRGDAIVTGTVVTGYNTTLNRAETDFRTVKLSGATGDVLWERMFNGVGPAGRSFDFAQQLVLDASGNAHVAGSTFDGLYYMLEVIKYDGATGATIWDNHAQVAGNYLVAGMGLDPQGNLIVGSQINVADGSNSTASAGPEIIKFSGQTGVMQWRWRSTSDVRMTAFTVDPAGSPIAAYARGTGTSRDIYLDKHSGSTGAVTWAGSWLGVADDVPNMLATDAAGNIAIAASGSNLYTVLKYNANGERVWQSTYSMGSLAAWANGVAFDGDGNVIATGGAYDGNGYYRQRTTKHASTTGAVLWESNVGGGSRHEDAGYIVIPAAGAIYVAGYYNDIANFDTGIRVMKVSNTPTSTGLNVHGMWWASPAGSESGWGVNLTQQGEKLFATWFTYDQDGQGLWLVMSDGVKTSGSSWTGSLHRTTGPPFNTFSAANASQVSYQLVGSATFTFGDSNTGTFAYTVNGVSQSKAITRYVFASPVPTCAVGGTSGSATNYTDIWWRSPAGSESGWGINLTHQGDTLFATWFTYTTDSRGMWLVASKIDKVGPNVYSGPLHRTTGPVFSQQPWQSFVNYLPVGSVTLTFTDANNAIMDYSVLGVTQSKPITRYVFASPVTVCR